MFLCGEYVPDENENESEHDSVSSTSREYVPDEIDVSNLIMEMVSSLERKPFTMLHRAFLQDETESLRFLFLINNFHYLLQEFCTICRLDFPKVSLTRKIGHYIDSYLHVSWGPVLKCLQDPVTPRCFTGYSSLPKFESKFQKTYDTQKF